MRLISLLCVVALATLPGLAADDYAKAIAESRQARTARLLAPDGWLSLIGLHWLQPGDNPVGSGADNLIRLATGPARFGTVTLAPGGLVHFTPDPTAAALIDNLPANPRNLDYLPGLKPTVVSSGTVSFFVIQRGDRIGLRVRDSDSARRRSFVGLDYFPTDPSWRIEADWVPFTPPQSLSVTNLLGQTTPATAPGKAVFTRDGRTFELVPIDEGGTTLFFVFADATSGEETYGACRFLYADAPKDGKVVLDFNRAQNPPCAFTPFATCPLPPEGNKLPIPVTAGEKNYRGESKH